MQLSPSADRQQRPSPAAMSAPPEPKPTVFIVDDDAFIREALETLVEAAGWTARAFASANLFLDYQPTLGPSCLVLDVELPGLNGLDLQALIADDRADTPIIFITGHGDIPMSVRAIKAGAAEFLTKPFAEEVLLDAIGSALERSRGVAGDRAALREVRDRYATLSPREREVMGLVVSGLMNKQVGGRLGITEITVKKHRGRVMEKMRARSLADLVKISASLAASR
jgi:FixJ family two-component response regulator